MELSFVVIPVLVTGIQSFRNERLKKNALQRHDMLLAVRRSAADIRAIGSGNIDAGNVLRAGNRGLALATLLLDGGKGAVAIARMTKAIP